MDREGRTRVRVLFGAYLFVHFAQLAPWAAEVFSNVGVLPDAAASPILGFFPNVLAVWDSAAFVTWFAAIGAGLSLFFAFGIGDRWAAVGAWYVWACLLGRNPLIANPSIPYVGWLLLAHACLPRAAFGDWVRRGRASELPWRMAPSFFAAAWILMALGYSYSGWTKLMSPSSAGRHRAARHGGESAGAATDPFTTRSRACRRSCSNWRRGERSLELLFAPLSLVRRLRPWLWTLLLAMHLVLIVLVDFADLSLGMVMLHLFTFDPAWIRPRGSGAPGTIYYDGDCGFCHGSVRFVVSEEPAGEGFPVRAARERRDGRRPHRRGRVRPTPTRCSPFSDAWAARGGFSAGSDGWSRARSAMRCTGCSPGCVDVSSPGPTTRAR